MGGWGELAVTTMSNLNPSCIELELGLGYDNHFDTATVANILGFDLSVSESCYTKSYYA